MEKPNYSFASNELNNEDNTYINARYADGTPFYSYKDFGGRMTSWVPSASSMSTLKKQMNLPTDNNTFRNGLSSNGIPAVNSSLKNWTFATQNLSNPSFDTLACTNNEDCGPYGRNYSCNANYEPWPDSYGNQSGSVCSYTAYPEIDTGKYVRKNAAEGGIGKACNTTADCGSGYECNNSTDFVGKNVQQTGYCAQTYTCADNKKRFLGTPYNSGIPMPPPASQNNNGQGYMTKQACKEKAMAQQNCVNLGSAWYAVFPGYCPVSSSLRVGGPQGALASTTSQEASVGFQIPSYATNKSSSMGGINKETKAFSAFNRNASGTSGMSEPLRYEMMLNPKPSNM